MTQESDSKAYLVFIITMCAIILFVTGALAYKVIHDPEVQVKRIPIVKQIKLKGKQVDQLKSATDYAAMCGGYVVIDTDDREILSGGCDK